MLWYFVPSKDMEFYATAELVDDSNINKIYQLQPEKQGFVQKKQIKNSFIHLYYSLEVFFHN